MECTGPRYATINTSIASPKRLKSTTRLKSSTPEPNTESDTIPIISYPPTKQPLILQRLSKEPIFMLGAQLAILLQWANPPIAIGSLQRSRFATQPLSRFQRTVIFMTAATYGTPSERETICSVINRQHSSVKGTNYNAHDPELQKWTAATLFVAMAVVHETFLGEIEAEEEENLMRECGVFGTCLRMEGSMWPRCRDGFWGYWYGSVLDLTVVDEAGKLKELLVRNRKLPWYMRAGLPVVVMLTARWLPRRLRAEYGLPDPDARFRRLWYWLVVMLIKWVYWFIPGWVKEWWHQNNMRDMQQAVVEIRRTGRWPV